jgi:1,3-beta-glucanosyltransferase GAS1
MTPVWSGGVAFSYFPAESAEGQFGMVSISDDGSTVTTSDDYNKLKAQYKSVSFITSPPQSSTPASSYSTCAAATDNFIASNTLPPTPNEGACDCLEDVLSCRFTPITSNYSVIVGELIGTACSLLGQNGANCDDIGGNGHTGTYGRLSGCDPSECFSYVLDTISMFCPAIKLSYTMSKFYELQNRNQQACSFAGNGTVNANAPSSASAADSAASSCINNPSATFTPSSAPSQASSSSSGGNNGNGSSGGSRSDGSSVQPGALFGVVGMAVAALSSAVCTLA